MNNSYTRDRDYDLWLWLTNTSDAIARARRKELERYNISARHSTVLLFVESSDGRMTPAKISRSIFRETSTISELLTRMERKGLVRKVRDLEQKNQTRVILTEKGREAYRQSTKRESIHNIMSCLTEEERQQLQSCLQKLREKAMDELGIKYRVPFPP